MFRLSSLSWCVASAVCVCLQAEPARAGTLADSFDDWSVAGIQGENGWFNGYYNLTTDANATYAVDDFTPFVNTAGPGGGPVSPGGNHWTGTAWDLHSGFPGPWTEQGPMAVHPAGTNSTPSEEHWPIRRWMADVAEATAVTLSWQMSKQNTAAGDGVGGKLFVNGALVDSATVAATDGSGITRQFPVTLQPGDLVDLALTPAGSDTSDMSLNRLTISDEIPLGLPLLADSAADWSEAGLQGQKNWLNGYYNLTTDANATYEVADFIPFVNTAGSGGGPVSPGGNHWTGTKWDLHLGFPGPWTEQGMSAVHPAGTNSTPSEEHWPVRRWTANVAEPTAVAVRWQTRKTNGGGTGVTGLLFVNGALVDVRTIEGNDTTGFEAVRYVNLNPGDIVELALSPEGLSDRGDTADGSANRLVIDPNLPAGPLYNRGAKIADSQEDWSASGTQGQNNWQYGYYDLRTDVSFGDGRYGPADFIPFLNDGSGVVSSSSAIGGWKTSTNHWDGSQWDLLDQSVVFQGPWTTLSQSGGHPAGNGQGTPEIHWAVRRWISTVDGPIAVEGLLANWNVGGEGVTGRIFVDGVEVWSDQSDGVGVPLDFVTSVGVGSLVDVVIDPDGTGKLQPVISNLSRFNDTSDSTTFWVTFREAQLFIPIPEPTSAALLCLAGLLGAGRCRAARA